MKQNFYFLLIIIAGFISKAYTQVSPADSYFPSAVGNSWVYDTPAGQYTIKITKDSIDSGGNKYIFYNNDAMPAYKIDSSGENVYNISNGLNLFKYQLNTDSGSAWIEDYDAPVTAAKINEIFPYRIFGELRNVKQIGYYKIPGDTSLAEDFSSGINTSWIIYSGTFSVDNFVPNPLSSNQYSLACNQSGIIGIPCSQAYGTWQFDIYKGADENNLEVDFIADRIDNAFHQNGYFFTNNSYEAVGLARSTIGSVTGIISSADNYTAKEGTWYRITITRNTTGEFYTYIEGGGFTSRTLVSVKDGIGTNPAIDTNNTVSNYFVLNLNAGDRISNILCEYYQDNIQLNKNEHITLAADRNFENSLSSWISTGYHILEETSFESHSGSYSARIINSDLIDGKGRMESNATANWIHSAEETGIVHGGTKSIKVTASGVAALTTTYFGIAEANKVYTLEGWVYVPAGYSPNGNIYVNFNLDADIHTIISQWLKASSPYNTWVKLKSTEVSHSSLAYSVRIKNSGAVNAPNYVYLDDIIAYQKGNSSDNYISLPANSFIPLISGNKYTYSMYFKSPHLNEDSLTVAIGDLNKTIASLGTWTKLTWTFQADDSTINQPIKIYLNQADTLYIDDVSLKPVNTLFDNAVYNSEIWLADGIGEYYEYSKEKGILKTLEKCIINGHTFYTSVQDNHTAALNSFKLYQNYPNPFNPVTNINYNIPEMTKVVINIYDILGRKVRSLVNEEQSAGAHSVRFSGEGLPSGVYIYRIAAGRYSDSKKLVLLK